MSMPVAVFSSEVAGPHRRTVIAAMSASGDRKRIKRERRRAEEVAGCRSSRSGEAVHAVRGVVRGIAMSRTSVIRLLGRCWFQASRQPGADVTSAVSLLSPGRSTVSATTGTTGPSTGRLGSRLSNRGDPLAAFRWLRDRPMLKHLRQDSHSGYPPRRLPPPGPALAGRPFPRW